MGPFLFHEIFVQLALQMVLALTILTSPELLFTHA